MNAAPSWEEHCLGPRAKEAPEPRYRLARHSVRMAIRGQLERSLPLDHRQLETITDELLLAVLSPRLTLALSIVIGAPECAAPS